MKDCGWTSPGQIASDNRKNNRNNDREVLMNDLEAMCYIHDDDYHQNSGCIHASRRYA